MPTQLLPPEKSLNVPLTYPALLVELRKIFLEGVHRAVSAVKEEGLRTSWEAGKAIEAHVRANQPTEAGRAAYGKEIVKKAAKDLGKKSWYLYDSWELAKTYPNFVPARNLSRSHYRHLLTVDDSKLREVLTQRASREDWSKRELAGEIRRRKAGRANKKDVAKKFIPKRGRLGTYQIAARPGAAGLSIDLGFRNYVELPADTGGKDGDIVEIVGADPRACLAGRRVGPFVSPSIGRTHGSAPTWKIKILPRATKKDIYAYRAHVTKVIDADTYWMKIDVALPVWREDKLRLRGVDAPELKTEAGQKAKKFVEEMFAKYPQIEITTTRPDKYDRYLSDVWISAGGQDWLNLNQLLLRNGLAVLKTKWSWEDWDTE